MSFPDLLNIVEVIGPDETPVTAEVIAATPTGVTVEWGGDAPEGGVGSARWPSTKGLCVLPCKIGGQGHFGLLEPTGEPMVLQRRGAVRVDLKVPVRRLDGNSWQVAHTVNISAKGLLVSGRLSLDADDVAVLGIELPDYPADPLAVKSRVLSVEDDDRMRIEFLEVTEAQEDRLVHLVFEQQRVALRKRHDARGHLRLVEDR
jgi:hypothetical protein